MPTNKQEREQARRRLQQQLERRREAEARRRKSLIAITVVATLAVIGVVVGLVIGLGGGSSTPAASGSSSPVSSPSIPAAGTTGPCAYTPSQAAAGNPNITDVGLPPDPDPTPTTNRTLKLLTNLGEVDVALDGAAAPCNVQSISYLAQQGFYNGTSCHRLVTEGIFVLQCGDPSGTGSGGPAYNTNDENLETADYAEGVVAMANSGPNTNSSQFFIMTKDSNQGLQKSYTVIGKVTAGLNFVQQVAAAGTTDGMSDGQPKEPLEFISATVDPPLDIPSSSGAAPTDAGTTPAATGSSPTDLSTGSPVTT